MLQKPLGGVINLDEEDYLELPIIVINLDDSEVVEFENEEEASPPADTGVPLYTSFEYDDRTDTFIKTGLPSLIEEPDDTDELVIVELGPSGIVPPDAGFNCVHILSQRVTSSSMTSLNRTLGEYIQLTMICDVVSLELRGWPPHPYFGRIILDVVNPSNFTILWPSNIRWSRDRVPDLTAQEDVFLFTSIDSGGRVLGSVVGQNYPL
jgi:hypothetical protein